jgi:hypothetical protein
MASGPDQYTLSVKDVIVSYNPKWAWAKPKTLVNIGAWLRYWFLTTYPMKPVGGDEGKTDATMFPPRFLPFLLWMMETWECNHRVAARRLTQGPSSSKKDD